MVAALDWHDWGARTWLQGSHRQALAASVRLTVGMTSVDWTVPAGTAYDSTDALIAAWNTALAGLAVVEIVPALATHRGTVRVRTTGAAVYSIAWSHTGNGAAIRDRLGETADVVARASGETWPAPVKAAWYSWHGATRLQRTSTRELAARRIRLDGQTDTQHGEATRVELDLALRFGAPPSYAVTLQGHEALRAFFDELWDAAGGGEPFAVRHLPEDASTPQTWRVAFAADDVRIVPAAVQGVRLGRLWDVSLPLVAEVTAW